MNHYFRCVDRRRFALLVCALMGGAAATAQADTPRVEVARQVKAFASSDGIKVFTLRYTAREKNQALVQVTHADHALDNTILLATTTATDKDTRYTVRLQGRPHVLLTLVDGVGELYLPGAKRAVPVRYDEGLSASSNPEHYLTDYEQQQQSRK